MKDDGPTTRNFVMHSKPGRIALVIILNLILPAIVINAQETTKTGQKLNQYIVTQTSQAQDANVLDDDPRLNVYQNILSYGANGDGVADNTTALQNAINAGYALMVPEGVFNFSGTLTL